MAFAPDGRIFVAQQTGQLRIIQNGALLASPFLTVTTDSEGERGLLGVAFDPAFGPNDPYVYVYYTVPSSVGPPIVPPHNRVSRFTANGNLVVTGSEMILLELENLSAATNHNGGALHFGLDGKLYVAVGENANPAFAQTLANRLGKVLRINKDGTIPADNPFFNTATGNNRSIWALGLRNPFTFTIQPSTGRIFINDVGDVGAAAREEINDGIAGSNYGWDTNLTQGDSDNPAYRDPLFHYGHTATAQHPGGCAIAGGAFYNPSVPLFPASYTGKYFYADLCGGYIRTFDPAAGTTAAFASGISNPVDLAVGPDGALYYLARGGGGLVGRIALSVPAAPTWVSATPISTTQVALAWNDNSNNEEFFIVYHLESNAWVNIATLSAGTTNYIASGLAQGTWHRFFLLAWNPSGAALSPGHIEVNTLSAAPEPPTLASAFGISQTQIRITWIDNSDNESGFRILRWTHGSTQTDWEVRGNVGANVTSFTDTGVAPGTFHTYWVWSTNAAGNGLPPVGIAGASWP